MAIYQQYYTSYRHPTDTHRGGGFGVQAETPGMLSTAQAMINKTIGYRIPRSLPPDIISEHPIALRFQIQNGQGILSCIQSSGKDELGRDGNYFAHSLVGSSKEITGALPPIFYWKSDFWVGHDNQHYDVLPMLSSMDELSLRFDSNELWDFVKQGNRPAWFHKLMCAVIDYGRSKRSIVILDTNEAIAQWIGCVTMALPPVYHPFLSFATYHHDPYTAPFMIIGTTSDSSFRFNADEYVRYFVLNAETGRVSDAPPSDYADFVMRRFNPHQFDTEIVDFFDWQSEYSFDQQGIGVHLDDLINFWQATFYETLPRHSEKSVRAATVIINASRGATVSPQRLSDLRAALDILSAAVLDNPAVMNDYVQVAQLLKSVDPNYTESADKMALLLAQLVLQKRAEDAAQLQRQSELLYSPDVMAKALRSSLVVDMLAQHIDPHDLSQVVLLWQIFEKKLHASLVQIPSIRKILAKTFLALNSIDENPIPIPDVAQGVLRAVMNGASMDDFLAVLQIAAQLKERHPSSPLVDWLYYLRVEGLPLKSRGEQKYWQLWRTYNHLYSYELKSDLSRSARPEDIVTMLNEWCTMLSNDAHHVIEEGLDFLWKQPGILQRDIASALLLHPVLETKVPTSWKQRLVEIMLLDVKVAKVDERTIQLYQRFLSTKNLNLQPALVGMMEGSLALSTKELSHKSAERLQQLWEQVDEKRYRDDAGKLIEQFFNMPKKVVEQHHLMVYSLYNTKHKEVFWELYWNKFRTEILDKQHTQAIASILDFWITSSNELHAHFPLIVPEILLQLPEVLTSIREAKGFSQVERELEGSLSRYSWNRLVTKYLTKPRRGILNLF